MHTKREQDEKNMQHSVRERERVKRMQLIHFLSILS